MKLIEEERQLVTQFKKKSYPSVYKMDETDNILFVEMVDFDVCTMLLQGKMVDKNTYTEITEYYRRFLKSVDQTKFDSYAQEHFRDIVAIMSIFEKHYDTPTH